MLNISRPKPLAGDVQYPFQIVRFPPKRGLNPLHLEIKHTVVGELLNPGILVGGPS